MTSRLPIVGVMGSGRDKPEFSEKARELGAWLALERVHLLTGGGGGLMAEVGKGFCETPNRKGLSIGVIPSAGAQDVAPRPGYPNEWVELPIFTHLHKSGNEGERLESRNHINILSSNVVIALPGGAGTASELRLAWRYKPQAVAAYLENASNVSGVPVFKELSELKAFVRQIVLA